MSVRMIVVNGFPTSGKDTFIDFCLEELKGFGEKYSSIDHVKSVATTLGWDGTKTPKNRKFLSDLKDLLAEWNDIPYKSVLNLKDKIQYELDLWDMSYVEVFLFVNSREPKEIKRFEEEEHAISVFVEREAAKLAAMLKLDNHADLEVLNHTYDLYIQNEGTLEDLKKQAKQFCEFLRS